MSVEGMNEFNITLNTIAFLRDDGVNPSNLSAYFDQIYVFFIILTNLKLKGAYTCSYECRHNIIYKQLICIIFIIKYSLCNIT